MGFYEDMAEVAEQMLEEFGAEVTLRKHARTPNDPAAPWDGPAVAGVALPDVTVTAAILDDERMEGRGHRIAYVAALASGPGIEDYDCLLESDGSTWKIVLVEKLRPAGTTLLYTLSLER